MLFIPSLILTSLLQSQAIATDNSQHTYKLIFPDEMTFLKANITLHNDKIKTEPQQRVIWVPLSNAAFNRIKPFTTSTVKVEESAKLYPQRAPSQSSSSMQGIAGYSCYPTVEETQSDIEQLVAQYPNFASIEDIGDSWQKKTGNGGYDLNVLKLTNGLVTGEKPKLFIHAAMHAREYATSPLVLQFAKNLLNEYSSDADSQWILDRHEIHLLLHMNPDGRKRAENGLYWRKNENQDYCASNPDAIGTDLNRNFSWGWNTVEEGSSGNECSQVFRGPTPASEPETQAVENYVRNLFGDHRGPNRNDAAPDTTQGLHIDVHSYSELVLFPWGDNNTLAPNGAAMRALGRKLARYNGYMPMQSVGLYPTDGTSDNLSYGELGIPHMTFELGTEFFQSCSVYNEKVLPDNLKALKYAAKIVEAPYLIPSGPDITSISIVGHPIDAIAQNYRVTLNVTASDDRFSKRGGTETTQDISEIALYIDDAPWDDGQTTLLTPLDGTFDEKTEQGELQINASDLSIGQHTLYLKAKDTSGQWGALSAQFIQIITPEANLAPQASFSYQCDKFVCQFDASNSEDPEGDNLTYQWQIAEASSSERSPSYDFSNSQLSDNKAQITLTVTDPQGLNNSKSQSLTLDINQAPSASFTANCTHLTCQLDANSSSDADEDSLSYLWDLGDGNSADKLQLSHSYSQAGTYKVILTVKDGKADSISEQSITVTAVPTPAPTASNSSGGALGFISLLLLSIGIKRKR
ncbi:PKD domain-containing protein [Shewanella sp. D64]|uniref:M14 family zinc carboxypeptidase n=1 Tax=unclassified Shewanella TaxID=196818 RepID=UPI0022BA2842|nr:MULTISPECIES: M14 family zinc carboxypeptidase [unclassified Shewanella]MEC4724699.1 PKD domain-containing protein [Shewanella sp. D64]MEC4736507.1 PKD domain-containing protein [Shewanella sp. E94]WBJ97439.1 PKD domain-containing protein [Shewanella sp. MTB7]